ncbi:MULTISPECIES: type I toxin-antitoxin system Fst family toxin [Staphylococcus]|uniref:Type I toxin-antitoxin system Fst family toxin n=1 Tax=Staphylococcus hsinchuensis TaxID=3051183 RepID=A0ABZ3EGE2_9STAP|nr:MULTISPECIES: type I toxin-antitoxin system Fst family toxin [unclassified Staphylococcus]
MTECKQVLSSTSGCIVGLFANWLRKRNDK